MRAYAKDLQTIFTENFKGLVLYGNCEDVQDFIIWTCKIFSQTLDETVEWAHVEIGDFLENPNIYTPNLFSRPDHKRFLVIHHVNDLSKQHIDTIQKTPIEPFVFLKGRHLKQSARLVKMGTDEKGWASFGCYENGALALKKIFYQSSLRWRQIDFDTNVMPLLWEEVSLAAWPSVCEKLCILSAKNTVSVETYRIFEDKNTNMRSFKELFLKRNYKELHRFFASTMDPSAFMGAVRLLTNLLFKMLCVKQILKKERSLEKALTQLKPALYFEDAVLCKQTLPLWSCYELQKALVNLGQMEMGFKRKDPFCFDKITKIFV